MSKTSSQARDRGFWAKLRAAQLEADAGRPDEDPSARYGRARFLKDAAWMELDETRAFSRAELRRRRDQLMGLHHPDRGGSPDMAKRINETYSRMVEWLDRRHERRERYRRRQEQNSERAAVETPWRSPLSTVVQVGAIQLYAFALMAAVGYNALFKRRGP